MDHGDQTFGIGGQGVRDGETIEPRLRPLDINHKIPDLMPSDPHDEVSPGEQCHRAQETIRGQQLDFSALRQALGGKRLGSRRGKREARGAQNGECHEHFEEGDPLRAVIHGGQCTLSGTPESGSIPIPMACPSGKSMTEDWLSVI